MKNISNLTDKDLLALCQKYGTQAILWKRKFIGLLPEVDGRELYLKKGCSSIYEFAAKFGGVTKKHTQRVIQIDKAFEEKGVKALREMLQEGAVSISKLIKVVSVVTIENESDIVFAVKNLSHESLETYVRDMRYAPGSEYGWNMREVTGEEINMFEDESFEAEMVGNGMVKVGNSNSGWEVGREIENGLFKPSDCPKSVRPNTFADGEKAENGGGKTDGTETNEVKMQDQGVALKKLHLNLSEKVLDELLQLQEKGIDVDALLKEFLRNREENIAEKKEEVARAVTLREAERSAEGKDVSRYINVKTKRILKEEYGIKCCVKDCKKEATQIHHAVLFSMNGSNAPDLLKPLCRAHHDILHSVNKRYLEKKGMG